MTALAVVSVVLGGMVAVSGNAVAVGPAGMAGSGTTADPYVITNVEQLAAIEQDLDAHYVLGNDVNATGLDFAPIGDHLNPFNGTLDGQGHVITGVTIDLDRNFVGLFGKIGSDGVVTNVGLEEIDIRGQTDVGGLVGINDGTVSKSYASGFVGGNESPGLSFNVGGLVGQSDGIVTQSYATANVSGDDSVGGLVGHNDATVSESYATGDVSGGTEAGGLVGENFGTVTESYSVGGVSGLVRVGGLVGEIHNAFGGDDGTVSTSYWDTQASGQSSSDGGTGLTTSEMTGTAALSSMAGFDFGETWVATDGYPQLRWAFMDGTGTAADPYVITNVEQLQAMGQDLDAHYVLGNDINASGYDFEPVGDDSTGFTGTLDGQGFVIRELTIDLEDRNYAGLFGSIGGSGVVTNVGLEDIFVQVISDLAAPNPHYIGGLAGLNHGTVTTSYATGTVHGFEQVGGLIGLNEGMVTESSAAVVTVGFNFTGGLVGSNVGTVSESYATGSVTAFSDAAGGLVGFNFVGTVSESYATGDVISGDGAGGLVGSNVGTVSESYATGSVTAFGEDEGGFAGLDQGTVSDSYWDTQASGQSSSDGGTGLTTSEMTGSAARSNMTGFDFGGTWVATDGYPHLQWAVTNQSLSLADSTIDVGAFTAATVTLGLPDGSTVTATETSTYASDDETVATVTADGVVTGVGGGTATIAATLVGTATAQVTVEVTNVPPTVDAGSDATVDEGTPFLRTVSITDPDSSNWTVAVDYGDGATDQLAVSDTNLTLNHTYVDDGIYAVSVEVCDEFDACDTDGFAVTVENVAPEVSASGETIDEGSQATVTASFTDPGTNDTHTATIDWGDGVTEPVAVVQGEGSGSLAASHTYLDDGDYVATVTVTDDAGDSGSDTATVTVENVAPVLSVDVDDTADEGDIVSASGSFTDSGVADTHTASIDWGDGTVESVDVTQGAGSGSFAADHVYADDGVYTVTITVTDDDSVNTSTEDVTIANVVPSVSMTLDDAGIVGEPVSLSATFADPGTADTHTASVDWGDGTSESVAVTQGAGSGSLSTTHTYATGGSYSVELTLIDDDDAAATVTDSITVTHVIEMDVKPGNGDETDPINARARGVIPVAIYTADGFDASTVDVSSLRFGAPDTVDDGDGATAAHDGHLEDVDGDGDLDLLVHFTGDTGLRTGDTDAKVVGESRDGVPLFGEDSVRVGGGNGGGNVNSGGNGQGGGNRR